jgi:RimJ/RimL family protein N-acetyltransferase
LVEIRQATAGDADALLALKLKLDRESSFMMLEPDERVTTPAEAEDDLRAILARRNSVVLVAETAGELVGYAEANGGEFRRNKHTASVVIGLRRSHAGRGIGRRLLTELEGWAQANGVARLELTVMTHNERALGLYRSLGYRIEGTRRSALVVDSEPVDEYWMAKLLEPSASS